MESSCKSVDWWRGQRKQSQHAAPRPELSPARPPLIFYSRRFFAPEILINALKAPQTIQTVDGRPNPISSHDIIKREISTLKLDRTPSTTPSDPPPPNPTAQQTLSVTSCSFRVNFIITSWPRCSV